MREKKKILVCPLDWGLGHATRCIPLIQELQSRGHDVRIASNGQALALLQTEFPALDFYKLTGYDPHYSSSSWLIPAMMRQMFKFSRTIRVEHQELEKIIRQQGISVVISDNRFGCWSSAIPCVMITHQLHIQLPAWLSWAVNGINGRYLRKFSRIWIPDWAGSKSMSGELTAEPPVEVEYIGPLTRFKRLEGVQEKYEIMAIISGPEPQRSIFEKIVRKELKRSGKPALMVLGLPDRLERTTDGNLEEVSHLPSLELNLAIMQSKMIISRSGYSTVMDLALLGKRAIFVPTPGQTEQEYLGRLLMNRKIAYTSDQDSFDLAEALTASAGYSGFTTDDRAGAGGLNDALEKLHL